MKYRVLHDQLEGTVDAIGYGYLLYMDSQKSKRFIQPLYARPKSVRIGTLVLPTSLWVARWEAIRGGQR